MCKIKNFIFIIGLAMLLSSTAYSKVCFLGGGNDLDGDGIVDDNCLSGSMATFSNCPGYASCVIPKEKAKFCQEGGVKRYLPEDCCTSAENYVPCNEEGQICTGKKCQGVDAEGKDYLSCEPGKCSCASAYKYECSGNGLIGVGNSCGGKYKSCKCDTSEYHKCDANAAGSGGACTDSTGTYYKTCSCPTSGNNWETDKSKCCKGYDATCTSSTGKTSYKCKNNDTAISLGCICGTKKNTTTGCLTGCSDGDYTYIGAGKNITCRDGDTVNFLIGEGKCGNGCHCDTGYYNYTELCNLKGAGVCAALGYTEATCSDDWIACPFNSNIKKCIASDCYTYQGFCTDQTPTFCATLGYTDTSCTGDWLACPLNAKAKKCLPTPATIEEEPDDCPSGQALINGACKTIHANCAAAGLYTQAECSATGYICGLSSTTIYTSATGTTATCYTRLNDLCPLGYATSASSCLTTPDGLTCAEGYLLSMEGNYYSGSKKCGKCECSLILSGGNLSQGCPCTSDKPYYVNGACSATCPGHAMGLECFMCSIAGEYVR